MRRLSVIVLAALAGCSSGTSLPMEPHCNPLAPGGNCMVPWPSSAFEVDDPSTATGRRLAIPEKTLPTNIDDIATDPAGWNVADGFSPAAPVIVAFPGGVSAQGLPPIDNMDLSLAADSPTVILDLTTGTRVAHFAELDVAAASTPDSQALYLRPAARLEGGHRYAVAITNRVLARDGSELARPPGFKALLDGKRTDHPLLEAMRPRFDDVLEALDAAGFPEDDLVLAWDFTVASDAFIHADMIAARDRVLAALEGVTPAFTITSDAPVDDGKVIKRRITGTFDAPLLLTNDGRAVPGTKIARDAAGLPAVQGMYRIPFTAIVPACASTSTTKVPIVVYGHGLLGDSTETSGGVQRTTAAELCMIFVGTDMRGMSTPDLPNVVGALNEISRADEVFEVLEQGIANHVALVHAVKTAFATSLFVEGTKQLADPTHIYYYGISQGAIFGTTVMAYEPNILRGTLAVGAANYSLLLERSQDWPIYRTTLNGAYPDPLDVTLAISLFQMRWDKTEGSGVANSVLVGTPTGVPAKQILMQIAIGDEQVPNAGSYWQARTMQIPLLGPSPTTPWGLTVQDSPLAAGSALVIYDGGAPPVPAENVPAVDADMHNLTRNQPAARRQINEFFTTGQIINECSGACLCTTGACD
ncbi:MAG TPA: hypothetical protein VFQ53_17645 [Kofleriaceae bacterium]|nr:hypothetical protein [Kofleriaceae bacterium]